MTRRQRIEEAEARRQAEMERGRQVIIEKHGANLLGDLLAETFDPDYTGPASDPKWNEGACPTAENKAYRKRMQQQVRDD